MAGYFAKIGLPEGHGVCSLVRALNKVIPVRKFLYCFQGNLFPCYPVAPAAICDGLIDWPNDPSKCRVRRAL